MASLRETEALLDVVETELATEPLLKLRKLEMTASLLSATNAGKRLKALGKRRDVSADVASLAKTIVAEWKAKLMSMRSTPSTAKTPGTDGESVCVREGEAAQGEPPTPRGGPLGYKSGDATADSARGEAPGAATPTATTATPTATTTATTKPDVVGDTIRDKIRTRLFDALCMARQEGVASGDEGPLASAIEQAMFDTMDGTSSQYKTKFQQLHFNLKDAKNPDLRRKVVLGIIDADALLQLAPEELASDAKREENQRIRDKKLYDPAPRQAKKASSEQFQCGKCRQRKCTYYQMQTRSADEPMTTFVSCLNCGNRWKFC